MLVGMVDTSLEAGLLIDATYMTLGYRHAKVMGLCLRSGGTTNCPYPQATIDRLKDDDFVTAL
jgi:hypothetical protein